jgi:hypothetical protein
MCCSNICKKKLHYLLSPHSDSILMQIISGLMWTLCILLLFTKVSVCVRLKCNVLQHFKK